MFTLLLIGAALAALIHARRVQDPSSAKTGELLLVYTLVLYCGIGMLAVSIGVLVAPERMAEMLPVGPVTPVVAFFGWAYLGMSAIAIMAFRYRGSFLLGPAVCWAVYFAGATVVHLHSGHGGSHGGILPVLLNHGLVSVILLVGILMKGHRATEGADSSK